MAALLAGAPAVGQMSGQAGVTYAVDKARLSDALRTLARNPRSMEALLAAGEASLKLDDASGALGLFRRAEAISPQDSRVKAGLGAVMVRQRQPLEALRLFSEASQGGALSLPYVADRGLAYDLIGDNTRAQQDYALAMAAGSDPVIRRRMALSQAISGNQSGAEATLLPLLQDKDLAAYRTRAFALAISGRGEEAVSIAQTMLPATLSDRMAPYLRYMPRLTRAQQAAAANLGAFPPADQIGRDDPALAAYAASIGVRSADARLVPSGAPLGRSVSQQVAVARPVVRAATSSPAPPPVATRSASAVQAAPVASLAPSAPPAAVVSAPREAVPVATPRAADRLAIVEVVPPGRMVPTALPVRRGQARTRIEPPAAQAANVAGKRAEQASAEASRVATQVLPATVAPPATAAPALAIPAATVPAAAVALPAPSLSISAPIAQQPQVSVGAAPSATPPETLQPVVVAELQPISSPIPTSATPQPTPAAAIETATHPASLRDAFADFAAPEASVPAAGAVDITAIQPRRVQATLAKAPPKSAVTAKPVAPPKPPPVPSRQWVQIATGRSISALAFDWKRLKREAGGLLDKQSPSTADWGQTNRLVVGPFASSSAADAFIAKLKDKKIGAFRFTSDVGEAVSPLE